MDQEIYFHVGLGKVASTFLQKNVFTRLQGIRYISTHRYRQSKDLIAKNTFSKVLISREFDRQFEKEVRWFTATYPEARIIVLFRRHDEWLASQYRRYVKNGGLASFEQFFDVVKNEGLWKMEDVCYKDKLDVVLACCEHEPLIINYDFFRDSPQQAVDEICKFMCISGLELSSEEKVHASFSDKQLKVLQGVCKKIMRKKPKGYDHKILHWLLYKPYWAFYHMILYFAYFIPDAWLSSDPLIDPAYLKEIQLFFAEDWRLVVAQSKGGVSL